jgi:RHS repeat-associated protein
VVGRSRKGAAVADSQGQAQIQVQAQANSVQAEASQPLRFQGQYFDDETRLHYNRFRYYDADVGRFVSPDPIKLEGGDNLFAFGPNASAWTDPLGSAAGGGGVYIFETNANQAYIGKGPYGRYGDSIDRYKQGVNRGVHMDTKSPCSGVPEAEYAEMVEHLAMAAYAALPNAKQTLNRIASPGAKRIDLPNAKAITNLAKCPGLRTVAIKDAAALIAKLNLKPPGSGK